MSIIDPGTLTRRLRIEQPVADDSLDGAGSGSWQLLRMTWASVQDMLPSKGERIADGINVHSRPARVRMYFRPDVTSEMRFVLGDRIMQIVAGPAELGWREGMEFMVEDYTSPGNPA
ncbi:head-tail adaptor protein [Sphingomonas endolithica]|uniref:head-tail adaptor protein n=1 Tax=Sphingomonas endolithica TaxID=2972485 RepID=UPI0021AFE08B|nr:head-tail adaptor protein [Sphingomonas sp. ZFBP2030]